MMEIEVRGHSGCQIDIVREGNDLFICKKTNDPNYFDRLVKQAEKQARASAVEYQHIRIPQIFHIDRNSDSVAVKMEYVYSKNFVEYFEAAGFEQISYLIKAIKLFIEKEITSSSLGTVKSEVIRDKFIDVCKKVISNELLNHDNTILEIIEKSSDIFNNLPNMELPLGVCHGDLTFSNILFNGNNYYLIDFLDSFVESPLLDIVKIRQDTAFLWSLLMYVHDYDKIRLQIISEKIDKEIDAYFSQYDWYSKYYRVYQLMNFLRILQYAHEEKVIDYLKRVLKDLCDEF